MEERVDIAWKEEEEEEEEPEEGKAVHDGAQLEGQKHKNGTASWKRRRSLCERSLRRSPFDL